ncbi:hypothetical protein ACFQ0B_51870 [Nonomuraea thailandensis]
MAEVAADLLDELRVVVGPVAGGELFEPVLLALGGAPPSRAPELFLMGRDLPPQVEEEVEPPLAG